MWNLLDLPLYNHGKDLLSFISLESFYGRDSMQMLNAGLLVWELHLCYRMVHLIPLQSVCVYEFEYIYEFEWIYFNKNASYSFQK